MLAVGKHKKRRGGGWFVFFQRTQLSCRTCQQFAVDAESSHQGEIGQFHGKEIQFALLKEKKKKEDSNFSSHKLLDLEDQPAEVSICA